MTAVWVEKMESLGYTLTEKEIAYIESKISGKYLMQVGSTLDMPSPGGLPKEEFEKIINYWTNQVINCLNEFRSKEYEKQMFQEIRTKLKDSEKAKQTQETNASLINRQAEASQAEYQK